MKKIISVEVGSLDYDRSSAESVIDQLNHYIKIHGNVSLRSEQAPYSDDTYIAIFTNREETDEEYSKRTIQENAWKLQKEERERNQFEELKKKFGV